MTSAMVRLRVLAAGLVVVSALAAEAADLGCTLEIPATTSDRFPGTPGANVDRFGGFSDLFYNASSNTWFALPDRGPGGGVLDYQTRVVEFTLDVNPASGAISNFRVIRSIPFLTADGSQAFNGLNPKLLAGDPSNLGLSIDPEGFAIGPGGNYYVCDEYGPSVYEFAPFDNAGRLEARFVRAFSIPENVIPKTGGVEEYVADPAVGRQGNRGFEDLAINPSGTKLYVTMQSPLQHEGTPNGRSSRNVRIYEFGIAAGERSAEYLYQFDAVADINAGLADSAHSFALSEQGRFALSGITALSDTEFLVIERDSRGVGMDNPYPGHDAVADDVGYKKVYKIDITGASDIQGAIITDSIGNGGFTPVCKSLYFDIAAALGSAGQVTPEKFEGIAFGPDLADGSKLLVLGADSDYSATQLAGAIQYDIHTNGVDARLTPIDDVSSSYAFTAGELGPDLGPLPPGYHLLPAWLYSVVAPAP